MLSPLAKVFAMPEVRDDLRYTQKHEWLKVEGNRATIGISDFAQGELTDIVYVELPQVGQELAVGDEMAIIESVKSTSDVISQLSGKVVEVNSDLEEGPEVINGDPYGKGWLAVIEMADPSELEKLMSPDEYRKFMG